MKPGTIRSGRIEPFVAGTSRIGAAHFESHEFAEKTWEGLDPGANKSALSGSRQADVVGFGVRGGHEVFPSGMCVA
jgi:hypothetical protein